MTKCDIEKDLLVFLNWNLVYGAKSLLDMSDQSQYNCFVLFIYYILLFIKYYYVN